MNDVFLSYARAKNEPLAKTIYERLTQEGLTVWWDRECMPSRSLTFLQEIRLAVRDAERTVVLVDEPALESEYVQAEWQYALAAGKPVVPLCRLESYDHLPPELGSLHSPDFGSKRALDEALDELLRILGDDIPQLGRLIGEVPDIPPHFQPRTRQMSRVAAEVMPGREDPVTVTGPERISVLHGMGGSGKSVLAAAFARSTATRQAFGDGVAWLAPDENMSPLALLRVLGGMLTGVPQSWNVQSDAVEGIAGLLSEKRILVVLDNVTDIDLVEPLINALDTDSRVLVTTRLAGLGSDLGSRTVHLGDLEPREALQLLADWANRDPEELPPAATELAEECGFLPFALAINGAMVRRGAMWEDLVSAIKKHELEFARANKRFANYPYPNVFRCIRPSIDELQEADPDAADRLMDLAAFHWQQGVPEAAVTRFWVALGCSSEAAARQTLIELADRSLLRMDGEAPMRQIRVHDIQLDYLFATGADGEELGRALLNAYGENPGRDWPAIEPDGYFHQHVVRHLIDLNAFTELEGLLDHTGDHGGNAWFEAAETADNVGGYLDDLDRASDAWPADPDDSIRRPIAAAMHYSLIRSSINSMSSSVSAPVRTALLRTSLWSSARTLAEARQVDDKDKRVRALLDAAPHLDAKDRATAIDDALNLARARGNQPMAEHLTRAAPLVDPERRTLLLEEALAVARTIGSPGYRSGAIANIAVEWDPDSRTDIVAEALGAAAEGVDRADVNQGGFDEFRTLATLVPQSSMPHLFELISRIPNDFSRAAAYAQCVPHVKDPVERAKYAAEGADVEKSVDGNSHWIQIALAIHLEDTDLDALFDEIADADTRHIGYLVSLMPEMDASDVASWIERVRAVDFRSESDLFDALFVFLDRLDGAARQALVDELMSLGETMPYDTWRSNAYDKLAPEMSARQLARALHDLRTIGDQAAIGNCLVRLIPDIHDSLQQQAAEFVRDRVDASRSLEVTVAAAAVEGSLRDDLLQVALDAWRDGATFGGGTYSPKTGIDAEAQLARLLDGQDRIQVLEYFIDGVFRQPWGSDTQAEAIVAVAELLQPEFIDECATYIGKHAMHDVIHAVTQSADGNRVGQPESLADALHILAPLLTPQRAASFLELADSMPDAGWRMAARVAVAPCLDEPERSAVVEDALAKAQMLDLNDDSPSTNLWRPLVWLGRLLTGSDRELSGTLALAAANSVGAAWRTGAFARIAEILDDPLRKTVVDTVLESDKGYSLDVVIPYIDEQHAFSAARDAAVSSIAWTPAVAESLSDVLVTGEPEERLELWRDATGELRSQKRSDLCARYAALIPLLRSLDEPRATDQLATSILTTARWWA